MSWQHVICCQFLADMGDMQILWLNESHEWHDMSCRMLSTTLLGDVFCCLFLLRVVTQQKSMLTWRHIRHVGDMSQNVACHWHCCCPACYSDIQQFQLSFNVQVQFKDASYKHQQFQCSAKNLKPTGACSRGVSLCKPCHVDNCIDYITKCVW